MKRKNSFLIVVLLLTVLVLSACGKKALPEKFDQDQVQEAALGLIDMINAQDTEGIEGLYNKDMEAAMTDEALAQVYDIVGDFGELDEIEKIDFTGAEDQNSGESIAVAVVKAKYEKKTAVYTISFDEAMKLAGLYIK